MFPVGEGSSCAQRLLHLEHRGAGPHGGPRQRSLLSNNHRGVRWTRSVPLSHMFRPLYLFLSSIKFWERGKHRDLNLFFLLSLFSILVSQLFLTLFFYSLSFLYSCLATFSHSLFNLPYNAYIIVLFRSASLSPGVPKGPGHRHCHYRRHRLHRCGYRALVGRSPVRRQPLEARFLHAHGLRRDCPPPPHAAHAQWAHTV